jgi:predicted CopG family antitoxin
MPSITIKTEAHDRLKQVKRPGQSFSDVILENIWPKAGTCGELLDIMEDRFAGRKLVDEKLMKQVERGRKRRSKRR